MNKHNGSPNGVLPLPKIPHDDARVQFDTFDVNSAKEEENSIHSSSANPRPGPIANWALLKRSGSRRLKEKLVFAHDFYVSG